MMQTPFYHYNLDILEQTLCAIEQHSASLDNVHIHYAIKANANPLILKPILNHNLGIDCVSGGEIQAAVDAGFAPSSIVFAGVGKADWEIDLALELGIACFNVESEAELDVIQERAALKNKVANIAFRVNPNVDAHTHANITTGLAENKFGIALDDIMYVIKVANTMSNITFKGLHFHIGSQITEMDDFALLCTCINRLQEMMETEGIKAEIINVGGG